MPSQFDESEFVDSEYQAAQRSAIAPAQSLAASSPRPPSREELDSKVSVAQQKLAELKRAQEELERERSSLEEARRRKMELQTGREEMIQHLTRGVTLLEEAEFSARRETDQMAKTLAELKDALNKLQGIREESWTTENWSTELTRALTAVENARMEWNTARLKWPTLSAPPPQESPDGPAPVKVGAPLLESLSFVQLCRLGFALTWPLVIMAVFIFLVLLLRK